MSMIQFDKEKDKVVHREIRLVVEPILLHKFARAFPLTVCGRSERTIDFQLTSVKQSFGLSTIATSPERVLFILNNN